MPLEQKVPVSLSKMGGSPGTPVFLISELTVRMDTGVSKTPLMLDTSKCKTHITSLGFDRKRKQKQKK